MSSDCAGTRADPPEWPTLPVQHLPPEVLPQGANAEAPVAPARHCPLQVPAQQLRQRQQRRQQQQPAGPRHYWGGGRPLQLAHWQAERGWQQPRQWFGRLDVAALRFGILPVTAYWTRGGLWCWSRPGGRAQRWTPSWQREPNGWFSDIRCWGPRQGDHGDHPPCQHAGWCSADSGNDDGHQHQHAGARSQTYRQLLHLRGGGWGLCQLGPEGGDSGHHGAIHRGARGGYQGGRGGHQPSGWRGGGGGNQPGRAAPATHEAQAAACPGLHARSQGEQGKRGTWQSGAGRPRQLAQRPPAADAKGYGPEPQRVPPHLLRREQQQQQQSSQ